MAERKWTHHYSERRGEIRVEDQKGETIFYLTAEEVYENNLDKYSDEGRGNWIENHYGAEIEDIMESRA